MDYKNKYLKYKSKYLELKGGLRIFDGLDESGESKFIDGNGKICITCKPIDKDVECLKKEEDEDGKFYSKSNCDIYLGMKKLTSSTNTKLNNRQFKKDSRTSLKRLLEAISKKNFSCLTGLPFSLEMQENILKYFPANEVIARIQSCPPPSQRMSIKLTETFESSVYLNKYPYAQSTKTWTLIDNFVIKNLSLYIPEDLNLLSINDYRFLNSVNDIQITYPLFNQGMIRLRKFKNVEKLEIGLIRKALTEKDLMNFVQTFPKLNFILLVYNGYLHGITQQEINLLDNLKIDYEVIYKDNYHDWLGDYDYIEYDDDEEEEIFLGPDPNFQDGNY
ncbi:hypothetical protein CPAV1605_331 [seawater metagenome]|uniref:Uncharacterized protein n=1 Tax=seawater metagenome TaxID=1561972 RepID=A0A5E8CHS6_9ZZZZ